MEDAMIEYGVKFVPPHVNAGFSLALPENLLSSFLSTGDCTLVKRTVSDWEEA